LLTLPNCGAKGSEGEGARGARKDRGRVLEKRGPDEEGEEILMKKTETAGGGRNFGSLSLY